ncbi:MAG: hypothetical protein Q9186_002240 [Xanthomendoza sp. 1 TL-2023]
MAQSADHAQSVASSTPDDVPSSQFNAGSDTDQDEREATELHDINFTTITTARELNGSATPSAQTAGSRSTSTLKTFWKRHVVVRVPHEACRDHFALERTYLGYLRTSLALAFLGVFIAQLFRLQHTENPNPVFGFFVLGIPLSCICTGAAILINLLGAYRFWRQQNAMLRGKIQCGGWEVYATLGTVLVVCVTTVLVHVRTGHMLKINFQTVLLLFVLVMAVNIDKG